MKLSKLCFAVAITTISLAVNGQPHAHDSLLYRDYSFVANADPWLSGHNASALTRYKSKNISMAEIYGSYRRGGFVDYDQSPRATDFGAHVESFYRISKRIVGYGNMSFGSFNGHDMTGSAFIETGRKPFDIVEDSLTNPGHKHRDTYHLTGALGWDITNGLSVGAKVDFTAANMAKYKDLRQKTKLMNLIASAGVYAPIGKRFAVGADYFYRRNTESIVFSTYGRNELVFNSFINYGPWIGEVEQFGDAGFTDRSREMPLLSEYHGFDIQMSWDILPNLSWFNAFTMSYRSGYYGNKSPYTIVHSNHHSHTYRYDSRLTLRLDRQMHLLDVNVESENLVNSMTTYRNTTNDNGASHYEYFDPVKSGNRLWITTHIGYTGYLGVKDDMPTWTIQAGTNINRRKQTGYDYPYYRRQDISSTEGYLRGERNIDLRKGILTVRLGFAFKEGNGDPYEDGVFIAPSDKQDGFPTMEAFLYREYQYMTAPQYTIDGGVRYSFVFPSTKLKTYVDLSASHTKANTHDEWLVGRDNQKIKLTLGCTF